jgi:hypothetical protein
MIGGMPHEYVGDNDWDLWDRREFMAGVALGSLTALAAEPAAAPSAPTIIIADTRIAASRAFAAEATRMGHRVTWIEGDITDLWYGELDLRWRTDKIALAGLTAYGAFFCLERLAMDRGLRTAFRGEHRRTASGATLHTIPCPAVLSDALWPVQLARAAMGPASSGTVRHTTRATPDQPDLLVSWRLAPKPGANA